MINNKGCQQQPSEPAEARAHTPPSHVSNQLLSANGADLVAPERAAAGRGLSFRIWVLGFPVAVSARHRNWDRMRLFASNIRRAGVTRSSSTPHFMPARSMSTTQPIQRPQHGQRSIHWNCLFSHPTWGRFIATLSSSHSSTRRNSTCKTLRLLPNGCTLLYSSILRQCHVHDNGKHMYGASEPAGMRRMGGSRFVPATRFPVLVDADAVESFIDEESAHHSAGHSDTVGNY